MPRSDDQYSEQEAERRRDAALKRMLSTPHKPHTSPDKAKRDRKKLKSRVHQTEK